MIKMSLQIVEMKQRRNMIAKGGGRVSFLEGGGGVGDKT